MSIVIHPSADVQTDRIGEGTRIWQYVVILPGATIGRNCNVNAHCLIEGEVTIGNNVTKIAPKTEPSTEPSPPMITIARMKIEKPNWNWPALTSVL